MCWLYTPVSGGGRDLTAITATFTASQTHAFTHWSLCHGAGAEVGVSVRYSQDNMALHDLLIALFLFDYFFPGQMLHSKNIQLKQLKAKQ